MIRYVAFLRGISASDSEAIRMQELKACIEEVPGFYNVSTYTQSGNIIFECEETSDIALREKIETLLERKFSRQIPVVVRMFSEIKKLLTANPFGIIKPEDKSKLFVTFLSDEPSNDATGTLGIYSSAAEFARVAGREVYIYSSNYGKTCFSNSFIEKKLKIKATTRNWATISRLVEL